MNLHKTRTYFSLGMLCLFIIVSSCKKEKTENSVAQNATASFTVDGEYNGLTYNLSNNKPVIEVKFSEAIEENSLSGITWVNIKEGGYLSFNKNLSSDKKTLSLDLTEPLPRFSTFKVYIPNTIKTIAGANLDRSITLNLKTTYDNTDKFPRITDEELLTLIQKQSLKYFWEFGHPVSGMARERNTSNDVVTTGGSGFGIMGMVAGASRGFINKADALTRLQKMVAFLKTADTFHGAFPHWLNGKTGKVQPFSAKDNGADLVETAFLMQGLLVARQYFDGTTEAENTLRADITGLFEAVEWDWFRKNNEQRLYWLWSPDFGWDTNLPITGWNESLIVYVLAASSTDFSIPKSVYDNGWAGNGSMKNGNTYYGVKLPLGSANGDPLFFEHYSFLGLNPMGLTDSYANYETQAKAHTLINYNYCVANPKNYAGYSKDSWGLTASDINGGYSASSPDNDKGYIAPTAAISSLPYTPTESMQAIRFFYYKLGDKIWGEYGFKDAFSLSDPWFADSYLAIDQGPQIVMIENYRSGLIWDLFMSCPEVKNGLTKLGFSSPKI